MAKKNDPYATLMRIAQEQQGYFTTKQAIEAGYEDNTHPYHVRAGNWERVRRGDNRGACRAPISFFASVYASTPISSARISGRNAAAGIDAATLAPR